MAETDKINKSRFIPSVIITSVLVIATILSFIHTVTTLAIANIWFMFGHFIAIIYAVFSKSLSRYYKMIILLISTFPLLFFVFMINHWPGGMIIRLLMIIPIGTFTFVSFRMTNKLKYEFPFLGIMALYILLMII